MFSVNEDQGFSGNRVLSVNIKGRKDISTNNSIHALDRSRLGISLFNLAGNPKAKIMNDYSSLMKDYIKRMNTKELIRSARKSIKNQKSYNLLASSRPRSDVSLNHKNEFYDYNISV